MIRGDNGSKRGISTIIASVLTVLITVAAVTILWSATKPILDSVGFLDLPQVSFTIEKSGSYTIYDPENGYLSVQVKRGSDSEKIIALKFVIDIEGNSFSRRTYNVVGSNNVLVYYFLLEKGISINSVKIIPIFIRGGEEVEGQSFDIESKIPVSFGLYEGFNESLDVVGPDSDEDEENVFIGSGGEILSILNMEYDELNGMFGFQITRGDDDVDISTLEFSVTNDDSAQETVTIETNVVMRSNNAKSYYMPIWHGKVIEDFTIVTRNSGGTELSSLNIDITKIKTRGDGVNFDDEIGNLPIVYDKDTVVTDGLVLYYTFSNDSHYDGDYVTNWERNVQSYKSAKIIDQSGNGFKGEMQNSARAYIDNRFGYVYPGTFWGSGKESRTDFAWFANVGDSQGHLTINGNQGLKNKISNEMSISFLMIPTNNRCDEFNAEYTKEKIIFGSESQFIGFYLPGCPDGKVLLNYSNVAEQTLEEELDISWEQWHHFVFVYSNDEVEVYYDNVSKFIFSTPGYVFDDNEFFLSALSDALPNDNAFFSRIDEFRIYNRALDMDDINTIYQSERGEEYP